MKKLYKEVSGKKLLKMFYKDKIKNKIILMGTYDNHYALFLDSQHLNCNYKLTIDDLLNNKNKFAIYDNNTYNLDLLENKISDDDIKYFKLRGYYEC